MHGAGEQVLEFEGLNEIGIPDHTTILDADVSESVIDFSNLFNTLLQRFFGTEDRDITRSETTWLGSTFA